MGETEPRYPLLSILRHRMEIDGRGVTSLVAGAGCPLCCAYCINKELLARAKATPVTAEELYRRLLVDDLYFRATGGGVTFGGGEALLHSGFYRRFRQICGGDWRLTVETSLAVPREAVLAALEAVDDFIVDIKDLDPDRYRRYTGADSALMESNLPLLLERAGLERIFLRVPLIPGYNTPEQQRENVERLRSRGFLHIEAFPYVLREGNTQ